MVELLVSVTVMLIVLAMASFSYVRIAKGHKVQSEAPEAKMAMTIALERIRYDVEMAGFGLPVIYDVDPGKDEAVSDSSFDPDPKELNDDNAPCAFVMKNNEGMNKSDVLAIKSMYYDPDTSTARWGIVYNDGKEWYLRKHLEWLRLESDDRFVILDSSKRILKTLNGQWFFTCDGCDKSNVSSIITEIQPNPSQNDIMFAFGLGKEDPRVPYRRVDYYLGAGEQPRRCAPGTGVLYRSVIDNNGKRVPKPVMYCVRDFQVAFGIDTNFDVNVDQWSQSLPEDGNGNESAADEIRKQVRLVRVFLLTHEGGRDEDFEFSGSLTLGDEDTGKLSDFEPKGEALHYRWKVLRISEKPKNI